MKYTLIIFFFTGILCSLKSQQELHFEYGCNFKLGRTSGDYTLFNPSREAEKMVDDILGVFAIKPRPFILKKSDVDNAQATMRGNERYLLYSGEFLRATSQTAQTLWAAKGVFAHEIAHHVLLQDLTEKDSKKRKEYELAADMWAARVLARMGATKDETLSALKTIKFDMDPQFYPRLEARIEGMESAFDEEFEKISKDSKRVEASKKKPFQIDQSSFNRWSIVNANAVTSFYDDEKIIIDVSISPIYGNKLITILLCSNDPYMPIRTVKGIGANLPYTSTKNITWNYLMDNVTLNNAITPNQLKVLVYASDKLPPAKEGGGAKFFSGSLIAAGLGTAGYSFKLRSDAIDHYEANYKVTGSDEDYQTADKKYINSQYLLIGGGFVATLGTILLAKKIKRQKEAKKSICYIDPMRLTPLTASSNGSIDVGIKIRF